MEIEKNNKKYFYYYLKLCNFLLPRFFLVFVKIYKIFNIKSDNFVFWTLYLFKKTNFLHLLNYNFLGNNSS